MSWYKIHFRFDLLEPNKATDLVFEVNALKVRLFQSDGFNLFEPMEQKPSEYLYYIPKPTNAMPPLDDILIRYNAIPCPKPDGTDLKCALGSSTDYEFWFGERPQEVYELEDAQN